MQHVPAMAVNAPNAILNISLNQQLNVQLARVRRIVKPVPKQLINVQSVQVEIIQMEPVVNYAIRSPDVRHVPKQLKHVRSVQVDIIYQVEHV